MVDTTVYVTKSDEELDNGDSWPGSVAIVEPDGTLRLFNCDQQEDEDEYGARDWWSFVTKGKA